MAGHSQTVFIQDDEEAYRVLHEAMRASRSELRKVSEFAAQADVVTSVRVSSSGSVIDANMKELIRTVSDNRDPPLTKRPSQKSVTQQQQQQQAGQVPHNAAVTHTVQLFAPPKHNLHVYQPLSYARQYFGDAACEEVPNITSASEIGDGSITLSPTSPHVMFDVPGGDLYSPTDDPPVVDLRMESNLRSSYVGLHRDDPDVIDLIPARRPGPIQVGQLANLMDLFVAENSPEPLIKPRRLHVHDELGVSRYESLSTKEQSYSRSRGNSTEIGSSTGTDGAHGHNGSSQPPISSSIAVGSSEPHQGGGSRSCQSSAEMSGTDMLVEQYRQQNGHHGQLQPQPPPGVAGGLGGRLSGTLMSTSEEGPKPPSIPRQERNPSPAHAHAASARMQPVPTHAVSVITATNSASTSSPAHLPPRPFTASNRVDTAKRATETNSTTKPPDTVRVPQIMQDIPLPTTATNSNSSISAVSVNLLTPALKALGLPPPAPSLGALSAVLNMQIPSSAPNASALPPVPRGREQSLGETASTVGLAPLRTSQEPLDNSTCNPGPFPRYQLPQDTLDDLGQQQPGSRFRSPSPYRREGSLKEATVPTSRASRSSASGRPGIDSTEPPDAHTTTTFAVPVSAASTGEGRPPPAPKAERRISTSYDAPAWVDLRTAGLSGTDVAPPQPQMCRVSPLPGLPLQELSSQSLPTVTSAEYTVAGALTGIPSQPYGHSVSVSGTATAISTELSATPLRTLHRPPVPRSMMQSVDSALSGSLSVAAAGAGGAGGSHSRYASPMAPPRGGASSCLVRSRDASPTNRASVTGALSGYANRDASPAARCGMTSLSGDPPPAYPSSGPSLLPSLRHNVDMSDAVATPAGGPLPGAPLFMPGDAFGRVRSSRDGQLQSSVSSSSFTLGGTAGAPGNLLPALPATATNRHTSRHNSRDPSPSNGRIILDPLNHTTSTANSFTSNASMAGRAGGSRSSSVDRQQPTVTTSSNLMLGHGLKPLEPQALVPALPLRPGLERELMQVAHEIRGGPAWRPNGGVTLPDKHSISSSGSVLTSGGSAGVCDMSRGYQRAHMLNNPSQIPAMTQAMVIIHRGHGFDLVKN